MKNLKSLFLTGLCFLMTLGLQAQQTIHAMCGVSILQEQGIDTDYYYRLTNSFLGEGRSLDTYSNGNNEPFMGQTGNYSGQLWKFTPVGNGYYRLTNSFLGEGRSLDTYSDGKNQPFMGQTGNYSGQMWKLTPAGNGYYRMTNTFLKEGRSLDTYSDGKNKPFMGNTGNYSGQLWKLTKVRKIKTNTNTLTVTTKPTQVNGRNVTYVVYENNKGSFRQTGTKKWGEFNASGRQYNSFVETHRDAWSVYLVDKNRGGMRIQIDLHTKKISVDGKATYTITKSRKAYGMNVKTVQYKGKTQTGSFKETGAKQWGEFNASGRQYNSFEETARDEWSVYLIDRSRGGMRIQLDLHTKKVSIDGKAYYTITDANAN